MLRRGSSVGGRASGGHEGARRRRWRPTRAATGALVAGIVLGLAPASAQATWSIVALDHESGQVVISSATCVSQEALEGFPSEGLRDIQAIAVPGMGGAVAQAGVDRTRQNQELIHQHLERGTDPDSIIAALHDDPAIDHRQFAVVDREGRAATFTGAENGEAALAVADTTADGRITFSVQGNILASDEVVTEAVDAFHAQDGDVADRTMAAMEAADDAGGDGRCDCATEPVPDAPCDARTAHVAYLMVVEEDDLVGDEPGDLTPSFLVDVTDRNIEPHENANPVKTLRMRYDALREGNPEAGGHGGGNGEEIRSPIPTRDGDPFHDLRGFTDLPDEPRASASSAFWEHWGDGRAELSGYRLQVNHYGEVREGELVTVYVTEPHDRRTWIKDDHVEDPNRVEVLKLLSTRTFDTGIYPYTVLSGVFSPVDHWRAERFQPVRMELDAQEWCGSESHRVWAGPQRLRALRLSYFDDPGESLREVSLPEETLYEDALLVQLRELDGEFAGGGAWEGTLVPDLWGLRKRLSALEPLDASITRSRTELEGAAVTRFELRAALDGHTYERTFLVEREAPRRVLEWTTRLDGRLVERAELQDSTRLAYWELNQEGDEAYREELGLEGPFASGPSGSGASGSSPGSPGPLSSGTSCGP